MKEMGPSGRFDKFPIIGNFSGGFSNRWKLFSSFFQSLETSVCGFSNHWKLALAAVLLCGVAGCTTKQTIKTDEFSVKERTRTTMCLGFIPIYQSDVSETSVPVK